MSDNDGDVEVGDLEEDELIDASETKEVDNVKQKSKLGGGWKEPGELKPKRKYTKHKHAERDNEMLPVAIAIGNIGIEDACEIAAACRALASDDEVRPFLAGVRWAYGKLKR